MPHFSLIDDRLLEDAYLLRREVEPLALKSPAPVLAPGQCYGSVLRRPEGDWRMYYLHGRYDRDATNQLDRHRYREMLAVSDDGLRWTRPSLELVGAEGACGSLAPTGADRANNVVMGINYHDDAGNDLTGLSGPEGFCVLDARQSPVPHARSRYTALFLSSPHDRWGGLMLAHSDDGLTWHGYSENPVIPGWHDTAACFYFDPRIGRYVLYTRPPVYAGPHGANRKIARAESEDLVRWSVPRVVLDVDDRDVDAAAALDEPQMPTPRGRSRQWYGITAFPCDAVTLGLAWLYDVPSGRITVELVHSFDGIDWRREAAREPWIDAGRPVGLTGNMFITSSNPPIGVGDELWIYASATGRTHHERPDPRADLDTRVHALVLKRGRWVGYRAADYEGALLIRPFDWAGGRLALNLRIDDGGEARVSFHDELGRPLTDFGLDEPVPLRGPLDALEAPVQAGPGPKSVLRLPTRGPVRLRVALKRATLFGWSWE